MFDDSKMQAVMGQAAYGQGQDQDSVDKRIEENIQKRELLKLRSTFQEQLKAHYSQRKYKEQITLACSDKCL